jgi:hypothetical protein
MSLIQDNSDIMEQPDVYQIKIRGQLDPRWADWFAGMSITTDGSLTVLEGPVIDQAALYGLLKKIRNLGMTLVSFNSLDHTPS